MTVTRVPTASRFAPVAGSPSLRRFEREMELSARLSHPHIVNVYDFGQTPEGRLYFTMKLIEGGCLAERMRGRRSEIRGQRLRDET